MRSVPQLALLAFSAGLICSGFLSAQSSTARYRVTFEADWSRQTHPEDFPSSAHFSSLIGAVHSDRTSFWAPGRMATPGIQSMAEFGATSALATEVDAAIALGNALSVVRGGSIGLSPGSTIAEFTTSVSYPLVTLVTMIAPSPDWFVGVRDLSLLNGSDWAQTLSVELFAYDAGTDSGASFASRNAATIPAEPIRRIDEPPLQNHASFGRMIFERLDAPPAPEAPKLELGGEDGGPARFEVSAVWKTSNPATLGFGQPEALTADTGTFWFFDAANVEIVVKVLDACGFSGHYWVFAAGLTDVQVELEVRDIQTGTVRRYFNPPNTAFRPIQDTQAFSACP